MGGGGGESVGRNVGQAAAWGNLRTRIFQEGIVHISFGNLCTRCHCQRCWHGSFQLPRVIVERPYFSLNGGIFVLKSGLRFSFRAPEVP